jgi:hypothetical protein
MRSTMFQAQVERHKRGMGNMTNIFPADVHRMLVIDCDRQTQDLLVSTIMTELRASEEQRMRIESRRNSIHALVAVRWSPLSRQPGARNKLR